MWEHLKAWWHARRPRPLNQLLSVTFDDHEVQVLVLERLEAAWNQQFAWADITRVCFTDEGIYASDMLIIQLKAHDQPVAVPLEAAGAAQLLDALTERGYFPEAVWRRAMAETGGRAHCWPPYENTQT